VIILRALDRPRGHPPGGLDRSPGPTAREHDAGNGSAVAESTHWALRSTPCRKRLLWRACIPLTPACVRRPRKWRR
jgi:hypothetical protein